MDCPVCGAANGACVPEGGAEPLEKPVVGLVPTPAPVPQPDANAEEEDD